MSYTEAKRDGYYQGYQHGIGGKFFDPDPKRSVSILDQTCLQIYLVAYEEGYDRARSDRALMLEGRENSQQAEIRYRDALGNERGR